MLVLLAKRTAYVIEKASLIYMTAVGNALAMPMSTAPTLGGSGPHVKSSRGPLQKQAHLPNT